MAAGESHHVRCLVRTVGADTTLDPQAEADTVEVIEEDITAVVAVVAVEEVMVMEIEEEGLAVLHRIRAATILAPTTEDITQGAEAHREDAVDIRLGGLVIDGGERVEGCGLGLWQFVSHMCRRHNILPK